MGKGVLESSIGKPAFFEKFTLILILEIFFTDEVSAKNESVHQRKESVITCANTIEY